MLNPYLAHYRLAFAFSRILYPQPYRLALQHTFPLGQLWEDYGLNTFRLSTMSGLGPAYSPVAQHLRQITDQYLFLSTYLLVQAYQHLWLVPRDDVY